MRVVQDQIVATYTQHDGNLTQYHIVVRFLAHAAEKPHFEKSHYNSSTVCLSVCLFVCSPTPLRSFDGSSGGWVYVGGLRNCP